MTEPAQAAAIASAQTEAHGTPDVHKAAPVGATEAMQAQKAASAPDRQSLQAVPLAKGQSTMSKGTAPEGERQEPAGKGTSPDVMQNLATNAAVPADANDPVQAQNAASQAGGQGPTAKGALLARNRQSLAAKGALPASKRQTQAAEEAADDSMLAKEAGAGIDRQVLAPEHTACRASKQPDKAAADRHSIAPEGPTSAAERHSTFAQGVGPVSGESIIPVEAAPVVLDRSSGKAKGLAPAAAQGSSIQAQEAAPEAERQKPSAAEAASQDRPTAAAARLLAGSANRLLAGGALRARGQSLGAEGAASQAERTGSEAKATADGAATAAAAGKEASRAIQASSEGTQPVPEPQTDTLSGFSKTQGTSAAKEGSVNPARPQPPVQDTIPQGSHAALAAAQPAAAAADPAADQHAVADSSQGLSPRMTPKSGTEAGGPSPAEGVPPLSAGRGVPVDPWGHVPLVLHRAKGKVSVALFSELTGQIPVAGTQHSSSTLTAM